MLTYRYVARDSRTGNKVEADIEAANEQSAVKLLTERGLAPLEITVKEQKLGPGGWFHRVPAKQKVIFSRQLSTLINAGLPLVQSLNTVRGQTKNKILQEILGKVINDVEAGSSLTDALARHPRVFDNVYVSLVAAGEASGTLDLSLERLANQQEKDVEIVSKLRGALIYPLIVLVVLAGVVIFMITNVLPQVETLYANLPGADLPFLTKILLKISHLFLDFWWLLLLILGLGGFFAARWARTKSGINTIDHMKIKMWPFAPLFMKFYMARFARTASTLIGSGVPMIKMLGTAADAVGNVHIADSVKKASEQVKGGKSLSQSIQGDPNFLELVPEMIHIGEQSGQLEGMMGKVADYYEKEVDNQIKSISTLIEPALMVTVGIIALVIVAAVLLPIYSLAGKDVLRLGK